MQLSSLNKNKNKKRTEHPLFMCHHNTRTAHSNTGHYSRATHQREGAIHPSQPTAAAIDYHVVYPACHLIQLYSQVRIYAFRGKSKTKAVRIQQLFGVREEHGR